MKPFTMLCCLIVGLHTTTHANSPDSCGLALTKQDTLILLMD